MVWPVDEKPDAIMDQLPAEVPIVFSRAEFDEFARLSGDDNPIHIDPAFAAEPKFGRTVAHGMLIFAATQAALTRTAFSIACGSSPGLRPPRRRATRYGLRR